MFLGGEELVPSGLVINEAESPAAAVNNHRDE